MTKKITMTQAQKDELITKVLARREKKALAQADRRAKQKAAGLISASFLVPKEQAPHLSEVVAFLCAHEWPAWAVCVKQLQEGKTQPTWTIMKDFPGATSGPLVERS
jgi:hypothetical protein